MRAELLRFVLAGLLNTALGYAVFLALHWGLGLDARAANAIGFGAGLLQSLLLNRWYVFHGARLDGGAVLRFGLAFVVAYGLNFGVLSALLAHGIAGALAQVPAMVTYTLSFYAINRRWVWRRT